MSELNALWGFLSQRRKDAESVGANHIRLERDESSLAVAVRRERRTPVRHEAMPRCRAGARRSRARAESPTGTSVGQRPTKQTEKRISPVGAISLGGCVMKWCAIAVGVLLLMSPVRAEGEALDVQAFLPLFEKNSLARKTLDMRYSRDSTLNYSGKILSGKEDVHLVFDAGTGKYRKEEKRYDDPADASVYHFTVKMWDGKELVSWERFVDKKPGFRALESGVFEQPGSAEISSQPDDEIPTGITDILFFFDDFPCTFAETVPKQNPKLGSVSGDTVTIETKGNKFVFSKKTGTLERIDHYSDPKTKTVYKTYELSGHVECSGVWIPLRIVETYFVRGERLGISEISVDPKTLRLLDKVEDKSIFKAALPVGCVVHDGIRKKSYTVKTVGMEFVEAWERVLEMPRTGWRWDGQGDDR